MSPYYQDRLNRATDHRVIPKEYTNKGRTLFKLDSDMTLEDKNLLLKDLSGRIPYNVKIQTPDGETIELYSIGNCEMDDTKMRLFINGGYYPDVVKPYLRPMSSMTEEERKELKNVTCPNGTGYFNEQYLVCPVNHFGEQISFDFMSDIIDWLNAHHFDYRGLIEKGLALEATEGMYKTE